MNPKILLTLGTTVPIFLLLPLLLLMMWILSWFLLLAVVVEDFEVVAEVTGFEMFLCASSDFIEDIYFRMSSFGLMFSLETVFLTAFSGSLT